MGARNEMRRIQEAPTWVKVFLIVFALYFFLVGIGAMGASFKMMGKDYTKTLLGSSAPPIISLFIGILATTLVQSSSTTTSIVVGMVAAGAISFDVAIFMVMGANVGTTVTNTIVSLGHFVNSNEYKRAFAAATVHDFFNLIVLAVIFPLEVFTGFLNWIAHFLSQGFQAVGGTKLASPVKLVTSPTIKFLKTTISDIGAGGPTLLIIAIIITFVMLMLLVQALKGLVVTKLENLFDRLLFKTPYRGLAFGILLTVLVQSSSITTSLAVPLVGAGILSLRQAFPFTMGANIGTTITAVLASVAALAAADPGDQGNALLALSVAAHHVAFNVVGVAFMWPIRRVPVAIAEAFARLVSWNRLVPLIYVIVVFYAGPAAVVALWKYSS